MQFLTPINDLSPSPRRSDQPEESDAELYAMLTARMRHVTADHIRRGAVVAWKLLLAELVDIVVEDLRALVRRDPAAGSSAEVLSAYRCFHAVLAHRIAHAVLRGHHDLGLRLPKEPRIVARQISEQARVETGVELHPGASIGRRFVVDHGTGTVVGETVRIGSDCYLLQGVVLGATRIADNSVGHRHPTLGDRVEVGSFARILGRVTVGDDVVIGCHALVRSDVPPGARVSVLRETQIVRTANELDVAAGDDHR